MEKKGHYKKGRQHHARNINPYQIFRNRMKKWKYPFIGMGIVFLFLASFDISGDLLKTDILYRDENSQFTITDENLDIAKKGFALILEEEITECERLKIQECVSQAKALQNEIQSVKTKENAREFSKKLQNFVDSFSRQKRQLACKQDLEEAFFNLEDYAFDFEKYAKEYPEISELNTLLKKLKNSAADLEKFIQYCGKIL